MSKSMNRRRWSREEMTELLPLIQNTTQSINAEVVEPFCKRFNRTTSSVLAFVYTRRKELLGTRKLKKKGTAYMMRKKLMKESRQANDVVPAGMFLGASEMKIPVSSVSVKEENGKMFLVFSF